MKKNKNNEHEASATINQIVTVLRKFKEECEKCGIEISNDTKKDLKKIMGVAVRDTADEKGIKDKTVYDKINRTAERKTGRNDISIETYIDFFINRDSGGLSDILYSMVVEDKNEEDKRMIKEFLDEFKSMFEIE